MIEFTLQGEAVSKKNAWKISRHGGMYRSAKTNEWENDCLKQIREQKVPKSAAKKYELKAIFYIKRDKDIDNLCGSLQDLLQKAGVVDNDSHITDLHAIKVKVKKNPRVEISLRIL